MEKLLKLYKKISGSGYDPFPDRINQAVIYDFEYDSKRMGNAPTITAEMMYPNCLDDLWSDDVYVEFNGERYYIMNIPSSSYSNESCMFKHSMTFVSERKILENVYFKDGILTDFQFFGDIMMFIGYMNRSMTNDGLTYECITDNGITSEELLITIENMTLKEALDYAFECYDIPYYFGGNKKIHFGYYENEIADVFAYGSTNALLSINRENSTEKIINKITGVGSSENIPYYYPNFNVSGEHHVTYDPPELYTNIDNINFKKLDNYTNLRDGGIITFRKASGEDNGVYDFTNNEWLLYIGNDLAAKNYEYEGYKSFNGDFENYWVQVNKDFTTFNIDFIFYFIVTTDSFFLFDKKFNFTIDYLKTGFYFQLKEIISINDASVEVREWISDTQINYINQGDGIINVYLSAGFYKITFKKTIAVYSLGISNLIATEFKINLNPRFSTSSGIATGTQYSLQDVGISGYSQDYSFEEHKIISSNDIRVNSILRIRIFLKEFTYASLNTIIKAKWDIENEWNDFPSKSIEIISPEGNILNDYSLSENGIISFRSGSTYGIWNVHIDTIINMQNNNSQIRQGISFKYNSNLTRLHIPYNHFIFDDNSNKEKPAKVGVYFHDEDTVPDNAKLIISETVDWITPKSNLMPSIYRGTLGKECFYEALNNTWLDKDGQFYDFTNIYTADKAKEHIEDFDDVKPTIVGVKNSNGENINIFKEFAFDLNDNNEWETEGDTQTLKHSYFFGKLRKFDGPNGFNLFQQAIESGEMTITMTSGLCGSCDFVIGVNDDGENTVQVDNNGDLLRDDDGNVKFGAPQERQQDTSQYEVWVALKKDENSFGEILPDQEKYIIPQQDVDTFVLTNILLPDAYILNAEKQLEYKLLDYMLENNVDKFDFSIDFSRIYLALNPQILAKINENALINVEYNGIVNKLYVSSFSYNMSEDEALPKITVELEERLTKKENILQRTKKEINKNINVLVKNVTNQSTIINGGSNVSQTEELEWGTIV